MIQGAGRCRGAEEEYDVGVLAVGRQKRLGLIRKASPGGVVEPWYELHTFQAGVEPLEIGKLIRCPQIGSVVPPEVMDRHFVCGSIIAWFPWPRINIVPDAAGAVSIAIHAILESLVSRAERSSRIGPEVVV